LTETNQENEIMSEGPIVITGKEDIANARLLTLRSALWLECKGMTRRGRSVYSIVKGEFGLRGNKRRVYEQFDALIVERLGDRAESRPLD
jgi:hypothetical protein